ncbi:MAG: hypothetical protein ACE5LB_04295 [Acidiferrobacterales bacterium]
MKTALLALPIAFLVTSTADAQYGSTKPKPPFGSDADVNAAKSLWRSLTKAKLVGKHAVHGTPYKGTHPHGAILETLHAVLNVSGHRDIVIVKKNYGGAGVSKTAVADDPEKYLKAITVMFRRERGYDADNQDWFWVKYGPNGEVLKNTQGKGLAGRVAKGVPGKGCIACHKGAPGGDYVFNHDRYAR